VERGFAPAGLDLAIASDIPIASGLSSSAALGVAAAAAFAERSGWGVDARGLAEIAHRGESHFVGSGCGILDPFAVALARRDHVLRLDCRDRSVEAIALQGDAVRILISDSGVRRRLAPGIDPKGAPPPYLVRVEECGIAFRRLCDAGVAREGARSLRDIEPEDLAAAAKVLPETLWRRVRHVVSENRRAAVFCEALARGDLRGAGELMREAHASLRDDFEVSIPELDHLCETADSLPGVLGSRLTGAGFGGATVHLVLPEAVAEASRAIATSFEREFGTPPAILEVRPAAGVSTSRF